jgi:glc operon protein GlcG
MKTILSAGLCAAALASAAGAQSAELSSYVIQGPMAKKIEQKNEISLDTAKKIAEGCADYARAHNSSAAIAVIDMFGQEVYFERLDGAFGQVQLVAARRKADTALSARRTTREDLNNVLKGNTTEFHEGYYYNEFAVAGGVPIVVDDQILGAIGVGGSVNDEACARAGLDAVGIAQPPQAPILPRHYGPVAGGG